MVDVREGKKNAKSSAFSGDSKGVDESNVHCLLLNGVQRLPDDTVKPMFTATKIQ